MSDIGSVIEVPAADVKTLRDEFAMAALTGYLAMFTGSECDANEVKGAAEWSYDYADAMLEARKKETKDGQ